MPIKNRFHLYKSVTQSINWLLHLKNSTERYLQSKFIFNKKQPFRIRRTGSVSYMYRVRASGIDARFLNQI